LFETPFELFYFPTRTSPRATRPVGPLSPKSCDRQAGRQHIKQLMTKQINIIVHHSIRDDMPEIFSWDKTTVHARFS